MGKNDFTFEYSSSDSSDGNDTDDFASASANSTTMTTQERAIMVKKTKRNAVSTISSSSSALPPQKKIKVEKTLKQQISIHRKTEQNSKRSHSTIAPKTTVAVPKTKSLPGHWPVSSHRINNDQDLKTCSTLKPGGILKNCSGSDIKISKNSDAKPTIGRGKYLFFLPGLLSLRQPSMQQQQQQQQQTSEENSPCHEGSQEGASQETKTTQSSSKKISPTTLMTLGKVTHLYTDNPILTIPLPNGQILEFLGRKIKCASKYLMLTFKTTGAVNCRNTFQEIVVFGDYSIKDGDGTMMQSTVSSSTTTTAAATSESLSLSSLDPNGISEPLLHYGGSERTLDGGREIRGQKTMKAATNNDLTQSSQLSQPLEEKEDERNDNTSQEIIEFQDDSDEDGNDVFRIDSPAPSPPPREMPSRRSTSGKKVRYAELLQSDGSDEEYDESDMEVDDEKTSSVPSNRKKPRSVSKKINYSQTSEDSDSNGNDNHVHDNNNDGRYQPDAIMEVSKTPPSVNTKKKESSSTKTNQGKKKAKVIDLTETTTDARMKKKAPTIKGSKQTSNANKRNVEVVKPTIKTPSPYSGRKRKNSTPTSGKNIFDITMDDDEFAFIE